MATTNAGPLNLSDGDTSGFAPLDAGRYNAEIFEMKMDAVKNADGSGKMPAGTSMIKVQFKVTDDEVNGVKVTNRRVFSTYVLPPKDYDAEKARKIKGMLINFFVALGYTEEQVRDPKFNPDFEDCVGRACVVIVKKEQKRTRNGELIDGEYNNPVSGVKPAGSTTTGAASAGGGLL